MHAKCSFVHTKNSLSAHYGNLWVQNTNLRAQNAHLYPQNATFCPENADLSVQNSKRCGQNASCQKILIWGHKIQICGKKWFIQVIFLLYVQGSVDYWFWGHLKTIGMYTFTTLSKPWISTAAFWLGVCLILCDFANHLCLK